MQERVPCGHLFGSPWTVVQVRNRFRNRAVVQMDRVHVTPKPWFVLSKLQESPKQTLTNQDKCEKVVDRHQVSPGHLGSNHV